ncbi:hypothetical protein NDU88_005581 [Pleurodeles waltl]|uniref:Uncharacterized protein n=1 Tax=Pleurodeles waltl TaxID=8319 RepID=A0AAV7MAY5_PLEWA|nr:hypothetical protein NDU88_005581 [Pleurodeles waltl]
MQERMNWTVTGENFSLYKTRTNNCNGGPREQIKPLIRIKGVPAQAIAGSLEDFVLRLFRHVAPALKEQNIREVIMAAVRDTTTIEFEGHRIGLYQDLSMITLQRRRLLRLVTDLLREEGIKYQLGHPFRLLFTWHNELCSIRTLEEAQRLEWMSQNLEERAQNAAPPAQQQGSDKGQPKTASRRRTTYKPSTVERQKEKASAN